MKIEIKTAGSFLDSTDALWRRVFEVNDASADSFLAADLNVASAREHGGQALPYHAVIDLIREGDDLDLERRFVDQQLIGSLALEASSRNGIDVRARQRLAEVEAVVIENNVTEFVLGQAKVSDKSVAFDELMQA